MDSIDLGCSEVGSPVPGLEAQGAQAEPGGGGPAAAPALEGQSGCICSGPAAAGGCQQAGGEACNGVDSKSIAAAGAQDDVPICRQGTWPVSDSYTAKYTATLFPLVTCDWGCRTTC